MKSLFPIGVELILILRPASLAFGRVLILDCHPELQWVRRYVRNSSYGMLQKMTYRYPQHHPRSTTHRLCSRNGKWQSTLFILALPDSSSRKLRKGFGQGFDHYYRFGAHGLL